jgi:uncharacterized RDD family membrane protein YckC
MADSASGPRASFGQRLGAFLIDSILLVVAAAIVTGIFAALIGKGGIAIGYLAYLVGSVVYFAYFEGSESGQTLGKRAVGIRVYDFARGGPIGFGRGFIRWLGRLPSAFVCYLGYLWMLWDGEKQTWHDKIATTVVVPVSDYPVGGGGTTT